MYPVESHYVGFDVVLVQLTLPWPLVCLIEANTRIGVIVDSAIPTSLIEMRIGPVFLCDACLYGTWGHNYADKSSLSDEYITGTKLRTGQFLAHPMYQSA